MLRDISLLILLFTISYASVMPTLQIEQPWELLDNQENAQNPCAEGTQLKDGKCLEISAKHFVGIPPNCDRNSRPVIDNGKWKCYEDFVSSDNTPNNIVTVPPNCPPGQQWVNGKCVDVWPSMMDIIPDRGAPGQDDQFPANIVTVPPNCPPGQKWVNPPGKCIDVWSIKNIVAVPPNCPPGQVWINGQCRDVWRMLLDILKCSNEVEKGRDCYSLEVFIKNFLNSRHARNTDDDVILNAEEFGDPWTGIENRRVVNVPGQCPTGFRPDANGICRPVF